MNKIAAIPLLAITTLLVFNTPLPAEAPKAVVSKQEQEAEPVNQNKQVALTHRLVKVPASAKCPMWWQAMVNAGWEVKDLAVADRVMWRESRCIPSVQNQQDPNTVDGVKGSVGLFQINAFWVQSTRFYPMGYLQSNGVVSGISDLFDPLLNIKAALTVFRYSQTVNECGWQPWLVSCN